MAETKIIRIAPQKGRQEEFLSCPADIAVYGGSAGGGKTWGLLLDPLRHINAPGFNAVIFRRTFPEITQAGGMWDEANSIYPYAGGVPNKSNYSFRFPNDVRIEFNHLQYDKDLISYLGAQICMIGFDQLETFTEKQFWFMVGRNRSTCGVRPYIRATCNPDPDSFVYKLLEWWIDKDGYANLERAGKMRWFVRVDENLIWADNKNELLERFGNEYEPLSLTFIPATVYDNPALLAKDPGYLARLKAMSYVERQRYLGDPKRGGNWKVKPEAGKVFNREWFEIVPQAPSAGVDVRGWDFAASVVSLRNDDPDFTASVKIRKYNGYYYVMDCTNDRIPAGEIDSLVKTVSMQDRQISSASNTRYMVRWEVEPGSAGLRESNRMARMLAGFDAMGVLATGDKLSRWKPFSAQASNGFVKLVSAPWNDLFLSALHGQPDLPHDDIADAAALAFSAVAEVEEEQKDDNRVVPALMELL